jgi:hypothetical protein
MWETDETDTCCYLIQIDGDIGRNDQVLCRLILSKVNRTKSGGGRVQTKNLHHPLHFANQQLHTMVAG